MMENQIQALIEQGVKNNELRIRDIEAIESERKFAQSEADLRTMQAAHHAANGRVPASLWNHAVFAEQRAGDEWFVAFEHPELSPMFTTITKHEIRIEVPTNILIDGSYNTDCSMACYNDWADAMYASSKIKAAYSAECEADEIEQEVKECSLIDRQKLIQMLEQAESGYQTTNDCIKLMTKALAAIMVILDERMPRANG